ncbi:MAG: UDP-N-acetylglucosamine--N-acetylmuramyl-(pentapeptide) pyrophosphoryl-undecaprenol N-acetylglucosamine transferase [Treponema sp.]|nr:UDP-N-acetylglucosamine--N-acetylmuramyl-(pentapeptide) pyrophosphoryl-undecaprenol N-acetylglucosamine transferase [Treponema sp.]MBR0154485.1 UDP-N-acetylglucosamine--N-acetylmuramyl-(pentapeptide) pyrophosphoryl-undecaprenol N-acetylglucosamine transferase [Treponema sp.]
MKKNKTKKITVAFAGGGTGGHIYPGLAIADELKELCKKKDVPLNLVWIGNCSKMDRNIVESNLGLDDLPSVNKFYGIPSGKLRRYFSLKNFTDLFKIAAGCIASFFILLKEKPVVLFSKGGFVSVPPCVVAKLLGIKVYTHECDFTPGLATKINSRFATKILLSYEETKEFMQKDFAEKALVTGNPVRPVFYSTDAKIGKDFVNFGYSKKTKPVLFVMGGSLGAKQINDLVFENIEFLCKRFYVVHQTGIKNQDSIPVIPDSVLDSYRQFPFIYEQMPHVMEYADVILSRAGANSLWECAVLKKPVVLIPLCGSGTRGDQVDNAEFFEKKGAAIVLKGEYASSDPLKNALSAMLDAKKRKLFSEAMSALLDKKRSAEKIADLIFDDCINNIK